MNGYYWKLKINIPILTKKERKKKSNLIIYVLHLNQNQRAFCIISDCNNCFCGIVILRNNKVTKLTE